MTIDDSWPRVMIIDDEPENLRLLEKILNKSGYKALVFRNAESALKAATITPPDLILLDIDMPVMNGFQACGRFRKMESTAQTPILFISALAETFNKLKAFEAGGVDYIVKPFQAEEVLARVGTHIELRNQKREANELQRLTLVGAVKAFNELIAVSFPGVQRRSIRVSQDLRKLAPVFALDNLYQLELAAMLVNLGCVTAQGPSRATGVDPTSAPDGFNPEGLADAARVIRHIPRLEAVASIIEHLADPSPEDHLWEQWPQDVLSRQLLSVVMAYEARLDRGATEAVAIKDLRGAPGRFHPVVVDELAEIEGVGSDAVGDREEDRDDFRFGIEPVLPDDLVPGAVLADDLVDPEGVKILSKGTELTLNLCLLIRRRIPSPPPGFRVLVKARLNRG